MKIRPLILLSSIIIVASALWVGQILINQLFSKEKEIQKEILRREDALLKKIQIKILETGYQQGRSGIQEFYSPVLVVEVINLSREALSKIRLVSYLKKNGGVMGSGFYDIGGLQSGETKAATITCSQLSGPKSSFRKLKLTQMEGSITFELWLEAADISMVVENGKIEHRVISLTYPDSLHTD